MIRKYNIAQASLLAALLASVTPANAMQTTPPSDNTAQTPPAATNPANPEMKTLITPPGPPDSDVPPAPPADSNTGPTEPIVPKTVDVPTPPSVTLPAPPTTSPDVPNRPLTADEAALIALRNQANIAIARAGILSAQGTLQEARSDALPHVGLTSGYSHINNLAGTFSGSGNSSGSGSSTGAGGYTIGAEASQLLFDFNHTRDLVRQAASLDRAAYANLTRAQSDQVNSVKQLFYTFVQNERLVVVNQANLDAQKAHVTLAAARTAAGLGAPSDVVTAQTAVANATLSLEEARQTASVSRVNLALAMGIDPRTPIDAADTSEPEPAVVDVNALVDSALRQRPDVVQAQAIVDADRYGVSAEKTSNAPSIGATVDVASRGSGFYPSNSGLTVGASVSWPIFDSGLTSGRVKVARADLQTAEADLANTRLVVTSDVSQAYLNLETAGQRTGTATAAVANAQEAVRLAEGRYRAGVALFIEVTDAQSQLVTAQASLVDAQAAANEARAALAHAIGAPLPTPAS